MIPKAELHVHLEGTAPPELIGRIARRNGLPVPDGLLGDDERFTYTDFLDFLAAYDRAASVIRTGEDYRDVTYEYLRSCAEQGAIYVELTASPDHAALVGLSDAEHLDGIARGIDDARAHGIEGRILISAVRNFGVEQALRVASHAAERPHPYVVGFSMAGDEENFPAHLFAEPYAIAAQAGLGCTMHAGEWAGPESVRAALELPITRISHGVRAIEEPALVAELGAARDRARVLPDEQRRPRGLSELRRAPAAEARSGRCPDHAGQRRPALLRRLDRRRVRRSRASSSASMKLVLRRLPRPPSMPHSAMTASRPNFGGAQASCSLAPDLRSPHEEEAP